MGPTTATTTTATGTTEAAVRTPVTTSGVSGSTTAEATPTRHG